MPKTIITFELQSKQPKPHHGFTLLELLVVVSLLGLLSLTAVALFDNAGDQDRFEATRSRLAIIRTAIIGDTTRTHNGEPMLSGYVADMGRLPSNLKELIELGSQTAWSDAGFDVTSATQLESAIPVSGVTGVLYGGWRGPYLFGTPEASGTAFRDGWGTNTSPTHVEDYGWEVTLTDDDTPPNIVALGASAVAIAVKSYGSDRQAGGVDYEEDYPALGGNLVDANNWLLNVSNVKFNINFTHGVSATTTANDLELRLYYINNDKVDDVTNSQLFPLGSSATHVQVQVPMDVFRADGTNLPMGRYAVAILCTDGASATTAYDGDCTNININKPKEVFYFTLLPNTQHVTVHWNTP